MINIIRKKSFLFLPVLFLVLGLGISFYYCLPNQLFNASLSDVIVDRHGLLLGAHIAKDEQWRFPEIEKVPDKFTTCLIQFEDKRFYDHSGVDLLAMGRAFYKNIEQGRIVSGGSTLSMQVIRLSRQNKQRTIWEKIIEVFIALRLETRFDKQKILHFYASYAPFGGNVVGLEAAAWRYFARKPEQLSWAESCMLAVLPNSPALIHLGKNRLKLIKKRNRLLKKLHQKGYLSTLDYQLALTEVLPDKPRPLPRLAPRLLDTLAIKKKVGQRFVTTLDKNLQFQVNNIAKHHASHLLLQDIHNLAIVVLDNQTFQTRVYIGNTPIRQQGQHGQAIDLLHRPRSTGSTLKPLLFASMIQQGEILPETYVADVPVRYLGYTPKNYDRKYRGTIKAKYALARSLNIPAVNMLSAHGVQRFQDFLKNMGMTTLYRTPKDYGLSLILGGAEGTLWELTSLYANLSSLALQTQKKHQPYYRQPIVLDQESSQTNRKAEISAASAWMTLQSLLEVTRPGVAGYWHKFTSSQKIAWKTGTSFGHRDALAIGTTPRYTIGVWVGNATGEGRAGLTGTQYAAPILFDVLNILPKPQKQNAWFKRPDWDMKDIKICQKDGFLANSFCKSIAYKIPKTAHFEQITPHFQKIHLDHTEQWQVHSRCESTHNMRHKTWFILPPDQAFYYQQQHTDYVALPPYRADCLKESAMNNKNTPFQIIYPREHSRIFIPKELNEQKSRTIFKVLHQQPEAILYWHLDNHYLGSTRVFHQQAAKINPGKHQLTVVDENGQKIIRKFIVLGK